MSSYLDLAPQKALAAAPAAIAEFRHVDLVFGAKQLAQQRALALLDGGATRAQILQETGCVLGAADVNLSIAKGEISVLMGLSGSGKSTILRCLNGLNQASRGEVLLYESTGFVNLRSCDAATLRRLRMQRVSMVFQQFALLPWRTVEENVGLGLELRGMDKRTRHKTVAEKLEMVGLSPWAKKYAHELSGGMQQRVGLARAFATDADILLMDEPFSALDPLIREHLQNELLQLQKQLQKTIVFVSHDLDEALKIGNHISIMEEGRIVQHGEPEHIVLHPANAYVKAFVAHMNPMKVLRAASLMSSKEQLRKDGESLQLDWTRHHLLRLGAQDEIESATIEGQPAQLLHYLGPASHENIVQAAREGKCIAIAPPDTLMHDLIQLRHATGCPVLLEENHRFVGVVSDQEIYRGLLRQVGKNASL